MTERVLFGFVPVYGLLILVGVLLGLWLCGRRERAMGLVKDTTLDMFLWTLPLAILGARLYYVAFRWDLYADNPISILYVWEGGLAIYGGVIGGALGVYICARTHKVKPLVLYDLIAPALLLGQAIGRWGNFINGEAYGYAVTSAAWQFFPAAVQVDGAWHLATFFYESVWNLGGFFLLYLCKNLRKKQGDTLLWYLLWYGAGRLFIEGLRTDSLMLGALRVSQLLSALMCAFSCAVFFLRARGARRLWGLCAVAAVALVGVYIAGENAWLTAGASALFLIGGGMLYKASGESV